MSNSSDPPATGARLAPVPARFALRRPIWAAVLFLILAAIGVAVALGQREWRYSRTFDEAREQAERGHFVAAAERIRICREIHPEDPDLLLLAATVARRSGAWDDAELLLSHYSRLRGDDDALVTERLHLRAARGELDASAPLLIAKIESNGPHARAAREALVTGLLFRFRWIEAERHLAAWLAAHPDDTAALLLRGKLHEQRQNSNAALEDYRRAVSLDSEHDEARLRTTTLLLQLRQTEELLSHVRILRERMPNLPVVRMQLVKALSMQGRTEESRAELEQCLAEFPDHAPALAECGSLAIQAGDDRGAAEFLERAIRLAPSDYQARAQYSAVLARLGRVAEAEREKDALRAIEADQERIGVLIAGPLQSRPNDPDVPHEIATIVLRSGQSTEGLRWLLAAIAVDPNHGPTHQVLANYYQASGNPALAARHRAMARQFLKKS